MPAPACPDQQSLEQLLLGLIDGKEAEELERHLADCTSCSDTLRELSTRDDLVDALRGAAPVAAADAEISAVLARMRKPAASASVSNTTSAVALPASDPQLGTIREYRLLAKLGE